MLIVILAPDFLSLFAGILKVAYEQCPIVWGNLALIAWFSLELPHKESLLLSEVH